MSTIERVCIGITDLSYKVERLEDAANESARYAGHQVALRRLPAPTEARHTAGLGACAGRLGAFCSARFQPLHGFRRMRCVGTGCD